MGDDRSIGQVGYEAYAEQQDWKNYQGNAIPAWDEVRDDIKTAWQCAAQAVKMALMDTMVERR